MNKGRRHNVTSLNYMIIGLEETTNRIVNKYSAQMCSLKNKAIDILEQVCQRFGSKQKNISIKYQQEQSVSSLPTYNLAILSKKKVKKTKTYETDEQQILQNAETVMQSVKKVPNKKNLMAPDFNSNQRKSQFCIGAKPDATTDKLIKSLKKLSMNNQKQYQDELYDERSQAEKQNTNKDFNTDEIDNQTLEVLNQNSLKKIKQLENKNELDPIDSVQSQGYIMTDYSSNQSSNDNTYDVEQRQESRKSLLLLDGQTNNQPLFGGMFSYPSLQHKISCKTVSQIPHSKISFNPQQLLYSPKKSPKAKRLFIRNKKIPKWAQNFQQIKKEVLHQKKTIPSPVKDIYGKFVVENLDSNIIFNSNENYVRTSSAKWNHHKFII